MKQSSVSPALPCVLAIAGFDNRIPPNFFENIESVTKLLEKANTLSTNLGQAYRDRAGVIGKYFVLTESHAMQKDGYNLLLCVREIAGFDDRIPQDVYKSTYLKDRAEFFEILIAFSNEIAAEYLQIENVLKAQIFSWAGN